MAYEPYALDEQEQDAAAETAARQLALENQDADLLWLMKHPGGRRFLRRLLGHVGVYRTSFNANAMTMAQNEGRRGVGLWLLDNLERCCPGGLAQLTEEKTHD